MRAGTVATRMSADGTAIVEERCGQTKDNKGRI